MPPRPSRSRFHRLAGFAACSIAVATTWLVVLPMIGDVPSIRDRIKANEARGINPGAMYYTELKAMPRIGERVDRRREAASEAFWRPSIRETERSR